MTVRDFTQLSRTGQLRRLRQATLDSLATYDLQQPQLTLLNNIDTPIYQVIATKDGKKTRYVLRIHNPMQQSPASIHSELAWLQALHQDTTLNVPHPISNRDDELLTEIHHPALPHPYQIALLSWVEGEFRQKKLGTREFAAVGTLMAQLHKHAQTFQPPAGFTRPARDLSWIRTEQERGMNKKLHAFTAHDIDILNRSVDRMEKQLQSLGQNHTTYGLIHSDLHQNNYLFHKQEARAIDFQDCGWGYYLYDIALTFSEGQDRKNLSAEDWQAQRHAFLNDYTKHFRLPEGYEEYLRVFELMRILNVMNWILSWPRLDLKLWGPRYLTYGVQQARLYLQSAE